MDSVAIARTKLYLRERLHIDPYNIGAIVFNMRQLARMGGHELDERFARAGLGAGPEARVAASIVDRALGGGGTATSEHHVRLATDKWIRTTPPMGT
jgi:hypothetical protein